MPSDRVDRYLVTGGAGFIGSHVVDALMARPGTHVTVIDDLSYAGRRANLQHHEGDPRFRFVLGDVTELPVVLEEARSAGCVLHLAAESDVGRGLDDPQLFIKTNAIGTASVLEACRIAGTPLVVVSTDGVYGSGEIGRLFDEDDPLFPTNPYAVSKAAADMLATSYHSIHGMDVKVVRGANAYGPRQHPEKGIPTFIQAALERRPIPVFGDGRHRREWVYVTDWAAACLTIADEGAPGSVYNIGGGTEVTNLELVARICHITGAPQSLIESVPDRLSHDFRYGLAWMKLAALGWLPSVTLEAGLERTVRWYAEHEGWGEGPREKQRALRQR